ncbi:hypothetical protein [Haematomicrobium sanguinis]|nr:hypothetical protein [Haematomicrobium sanguinis]
MNTTCAPAEHAVINSDVTMVLLDAGYALPYVEAAIGEGPPWSDIIH